MKNNTRNKYAIDNNRFKYWLYAMFFSSVMIAGFISFMWLVAFIVCFY